MTKQTETFITIKILKTSAKILKLIAAYTDENQYHIIERLLKKEGSKMGIKYKN